jgi:hypothetical protein
MRRLVVLLTCVAFSIAGLHAQQSASSAQSDNRLPVKRVVLYKAGVGYFEHVGDVTGAEDVTISFTSGQLDDALKSLSAVDLGTGGVTGIRYNSVAPIAERLRALRLPLGEFTSLDELLLALRGARVTVRAGAAPGVAGRLVSLDRKTRVRDEGKVEEYTLVVLAGDGGELRSFELTPSLVISLGDVDLRRELNEYLRIVGSARERDVRRMTVSTAGTGRRQLLVSYISEVPVWKVNYRLVLDAAPQAKPLLQAWAIVDNTVGEDWNDVELSLIAGAPQSFVQRISQPLYTRRPVVGLPTTALLTPQTHQATLREGTMGIRGRVLDAAGNALPGASVTLLSPAGAELRGVTSGVDGAYSFTPLEEGTYQLRATLPGFSPATAAVGVSRGAETTQDLRLGTAALSESVAVSAETRDAVRRSRAEALDPSPPVPAAAPQAARGVGSGAGVGVGGGSAGGMYRLDPAADAQPVGDVFEYRLKQPVSVRRNESALVPIARAEIDAEKVTLWSARGNRAVRAVWVTNSSGLTLDGGTFSVIEGGAFAGEGLLELVKPGERRLLSYAADPGVRVESKREQEAMRIFRASAKSGLLVIRRERRERRTYTIRNDNDAARVVVVEHPLQAGWSLTSSVEAAEQAAGITRFRLPVDAHNTVSFVVTETRPEEAGVSVTEVNQDLLQILIKGGLSAEAVERALQPVLAKLAEANAARAQMRMHQEEMSQIESDQARLRENIKALSQSRADRSLIDRYTRQMGAQEDRLEALRREIQRLQSQVTALEQEAQRLLDAVTLEAPAAR